MYDRPPPWCSHSGSMVYVNPVLQHGEWRGGECWCEACPARWELVWGDRKADGKRVPTSWRYAGS